MAVKRILLSFFSVIIISNIVSCRSVAVKCYNLETPKFTEKSSIKIVLIADLHSTIYGENQEPLVNKIKRQNPDLILLSGDIVDDKIPILGTKLLLSGIRNIAPVYYVTGNHEYWSNDIQAIRNELELYGVIILSDRYEKIVVGGNEIIIAGIEDPDKKLYEDPEYDQAEGMKEAFEELDGIHLYKILLAHRPENIEYYKNYSFDLILSGHTHGGQVRLPFIMNGLYAPDQGFFPKYAGGIYKHGNLNHIISRGLSVDPRIPRIFNPPELVVIVIGSSGNMTGKE
jgi:predicted MPP superfamily phosphohydrolase